MYFDYLRVTKITDFTPLPSQNSSNAGFLYSHLSRRNIWTAFCCVEARKTNKTNISPSRRNKTVDICCVAAEALRSAAQSSICEPPGDIFETVTQRIIQNSAGRSCFIHEFNNFTHRHSSNRAKLCRTLHFHKKVPGLLQSQGQKYDYKINYLRAGISFEKSHTSEDHPRD